MPVRVQVRRIKRRRAAAPGQDGEPLTILRLGIRKSPRRFGRTPAPRARQGFQHHLSRHAPSCPTCPTCPTCLTRSACPCPTCPAPRDVWTVGCRIVEWIGSSSILQGSSSTTFGFFDPLSVSLSVSCGKNPNAQNNPLFCRAFYNALRGIFLLRVACNSLARRHGCLHMARLVCLWRACKAPTQGDPQWLR